MPLQSQCYTVLGTLTGCSVTDTRSKAGASRTVVQRLETQQQMPTEERMPTQQQHMPTEEQLPTQQQMPMSMENWLGLNW